MNGPVIDAAPDRVDINIHPAKLEVRLLDEAAIGAALGELLRGALGRRPVELSSDHWSAIGGALLTSDHWTQPAVREEGGEWDDARPIVTPNMPSLRLIGQIQDRLLLLEGPAGLADLAQHQVVRLGHGGGMRAAGAVEGDDAAVGEMFAQVVEGAAVAEPDLHDRPVGGQLHRDRSHLGREGAEQRVHVVEALAEHPGLSRPAPHVAERRPRIEHHLPSLPTDHRQARGQRTPRDPQRPTPRALSRREQARPPPRPVEEQAERSENVHPHERLDAHPRQRRDRPDRAGR